MNTAVTTLPSRDMQAFQKALQSSKHIIAVAGAGLSAASGIPTFRGAGGMWRKYDAMSLATPEAFQDNPSRVWQFYHYRREKALRAQPNAVHLALAQFSINSFRNVIAPNSSFTFITQNVDGLSTRAWDGVVSAAGLAMTEADKHPALLEMHDRLFDVVCTSRRCRHRESNFNSPICPALGGTEDLVEHGQIEPDIPLHELPRCSNEIYKLVVEADLCLVVGTSSTVYPAAGYANEVQEHGGDVAVFNLDRSAGDQDAEFLFLGPCEETIPEALTLAPKTTYKYP